MLKEDLLSNIIEIVHQCGKIMLSATDIERKIHQKAGKGNFVTDYDSRVQEALRSRLLMLLPEAVFMGEEDEMDCADISITERTGYIGRVRALASAVARLYAAQREEMGYPMLQSGARVA